jgi:hypothetical protein
MSAAGTRASASRWPYETSTRAIQSRFNQPPSHLSSALGDVREEDRESEQPVVQNKNTISPVRYEDYGSFAKGKVGLSREPVVYKRDAYRYENEVRAILKGEYTMNVDSEGVPAMDNENAPNEEVRPVRLSEENVSRMDIKLEDGFLSR